MATQLEEQEQADVPLKTAFSESEFPYRALSRAAVVAVVLAPLGALGLTPTFAPMLVLCAFGLLAAILGIRATLRYPQEYSGKLLAQIGLVGNGLLLAGGVAVHAYTYATEVPEGYARISFYSLQQPTGAPDVPTAVAIELDKQDIFLKGYIHPTSGSGQLSRFVLVPDLGTCCFGGQPRSTDMMEVTLTDGQTVRSGLRKIKLAGRFMVTPGGATRKDFDNPVYYRLRAEHAK